MANFTPGPWEYRKLTLGHPDNAKNPIVSAPDNYIARVFSTEATWPGLTSRAPDAATAEANARLIAAAPTLLEALEEATPWIEYSHHPSDNIKVDAAYAKAQAAIAKAKGEDTNG